MRFSNEGFDQLEEQIMARRRKWHHDGSIKEGAFSEGKLQAMISMLSGLHMKMEAALIKFDITQQDLLGMFVKPVHQHVLTEVGKIARVSGTTNFCHSMLGVDVYFYVDEPKFAHPKYMGSEIMEYPEGVRKLTQWVTLKKKLYDELRLGEKVLNSMNEMCETPAQMRFYLDCLPALGQDIPYTVPRTLPNLPIELRTACQDLNTFVAKALILPKPESDGVTCDGINASIVVTKRIHAPWEK